MLTEKHKNIDLGELSLAIKESLDYLSLTGAECSYDCLCQGKIDGKKVRLTTKEIRSLEK